MYFLRFLIFAGAISQAVEIEKHWNIEHVNYRLPGLFTRRAIGINGAWPIPNVEATMGDTLVIHVTNLLNEPTSLHSHGLFQNGTNYYDGASMVTECGIPPNGTFTYRIPLQQSGTYWIHSHYKAQTADGLRMPLIIYDPNETFRYEKEIILPMQDWYREPAKVLMKQFNNPDPYVRFKPIVPYAIVGGECPSQKRIKFLPERTYRIRLLNIGASFDFHFSLEGHTLRLIEVDGVMVKETITHGVTLSPGQRVSVLVTTKDNCDDNYWFHTDMFTDLLQMPKYNPLNFTGIVQYSRHARTKHIIGGAGVWKSTADLDLEPLDGEPLLEPVDNSITLNAYSGVFSDQTFRHSFNNITYSTPEVPTLLTALTTGKNANQSDIYGKQTDTHVLNYMDVVQITVNNHDYYSHPFHLHGHVFQIVETGSIKPGQHQAKYSLDVPAKRDTVVIRGGHYAVIRFRADNPGVWLFHCHIDFHIMLGLEMTFVEAPTQMQHRLNGKLPEQYRENCIAQGIKTKGDAFGNVKLGKSDERDILEPTPLQDQFESYDPPSGWKMVSYILGQPPCHHHY